MIQFALAFGPGLNEPFLTAFFAALVVIAIGVASLIFGAVMRKQRAEDIPDPPPPPAATDRNEWTSSTFGSDSYGAAFPVETTSTGYVASELASSEPAATDSDSSESGGGDSGGFESGGGESGGGGASGGWS